MLPGLVGIGHLLSSRYDGSMKRAEAFHEKRAHDPSSPLVAVVVHDLSFPAHWHEDVEVVVCLKGRLGAVLEGGRSDLEPGDALLAAPRSIHGYPRGGSNRAVLLIFPALLASPPAAPPSASAPLRSLIVRASEDPRRASAIAAAASAAADRASFPCDRVLAGAGTAVLLRGLFFTPGGDGRKAHPPTASRGFEPALRRALAAMEDRFASGLTLKEAAAAAGLSPWYFSRAFPRYAGSRFVDWLAERRLSEAERLLEDSDLSIAEISEESGFGSMRSMDRAFRERRGRSPRAFRGAAPLSIR